MQLKPQRFTIEQFRKQADWIGNLIGPLNSWINDIVLASTNQFTVADNLYQEIKEIKFKNETNSFPLRFRAKFNVNPQGMLLIYIYNNTLGQYASQTPIVEWSFNNGEVIISAASGLTSGHVYTVRFLVIYG